MILKLLFVTIASFQLAQAPLVGADPADSAPDRTAPTSVVAQASPPPTVSLEDRAKVEALRNFWAMNFAKLTPDDWTFIAVYYGVRAMFVIILMTLAWTLSAWAASAVAIALRRVKFDETLTIFFSRLLRWVILLLVAMTCLSYFGVETTGFAAVIGAAGLAIGLAFQGTLSNFAAGAMLLIFRPYKVGDSVVVAGNAGTVAEIELFTTALDTADNRRIIIPNSSIFGSVIENHTANALRRAEVLVGVAYSADIDETRAALNRAAVSVTLLSAERKPEVALLNLASSSVDWAVRAWAKRDALGDARQELLRAVKMELDRSGIGIPYPQLDVHFDGAPEPGFGQRAA